MNINKKQRKLLLALGVMVCFVIIVSVIIINMSTLDADSKGDSTVADSTVADSTVADIGITDYYLTVYSDGDELDHTWEEINLYSKYDYQNMGIDAYKVAGILCVGEESAEKEECTVSIRGSSSSLAEQKSYKIKGDNIYHINKHIWDYTRFMNKMLYDFMKEIPQMTGLDTEFVHLYVDDQTETGVHDVSSLAEAEYVDYGLFTRVDALSDNNMVKYGLSSEGSLYKVENCEFFPCTEEEIDSETLLEKKSEGDNSEMLKLIDAVNDENISSEDFVAQYIDQESFAYWMAFHILMDNLDTENQNFYVYLNPQTRKWSIYSWDNDGAFVRLLSQYEDIHVDPWQYGVKNYWNNQLFRRLLEVEQFRNNLQSAAKDILSVLTEEKIRQMIGNYDQIVIPFLESLPDSTYAPSLEVHEKFCNQIPEQIQEGYARLEASLHEPQPFYLGVPVMNEAGQMEFYWDPAVDLDGDSVEYRFEIFSDAEKKECLFSCEGIQENHIYIDEMPLEGTFYVQVTASDSMGNETTQFTYSEEMGDMSAFTFMGDGSIEETQTLQE